MATQLFSNISEVQRGMRVAVLPNSNPPGMRGNLTGTVHAITAPYVGVDLENARAGFLNNLDGTLRSQTGWWFHWLELYPYSDSALERAVADYVAKELVT